MRAGRRGSGASLRRRRGSRLDAERPEVRATVVRCFDAWRDAAYDVEAGARRWRIAPAGDLEGAAWGFFAALDREEKAATEYELAWRAWGPLPS